MTQRRLVIMFLYFVVNCLKWPVPVCVMLVSSAKLEKLDKPSDAAIAC